ncbi:MAG: cytochrome c peroxidase [Actinomycetota bacterium]|nr:cytochrome c peroxidase [Actinomycetota bacterium]
MRRAAFAGIAVAVVVAGCSSGGPDLATIVEDQDLQPFEATIDADPALVALGDALFWDPILSGNKNMACSTCHHTRFASGDGLSISIGQGGTGIGTERTMVDAMLIPRNATEVFNRGASEWTVQFWDGRVEGTPETGWSSSAGEQLPEGLDNVLAVQAMFPVASAGEMRGNPEDEEIFGVHNEIGELGDDDYTGIWAALTARLVEIPEYVEMFAAAYPAVSVDDLGFEHAANALAAYQATVFDLTDSPWNRYLAGDTAALSDDAVRGAAHFYGDATCATCHSGPLMSDQGFHSLAVPQIGPGKDEDAPEDFGRGRETQVDADMYAFRTPSLHNVALSGPWTHDGAFSSLEAVIRHHMDPETSLASYDVAQAVGPSLQFVNRDRYLDPLLASVDPLLEAIPNLTDEQITDLVAFLNALTDPAAMNLDHLVPESVPSGLPVDE